MLLAGCDAVATVAPPLLTTTSYSVGGQPREPLKRLRDKIEISLQRIGFKADERKYQPHVTLARMRRGNADRVGRFLEANGLLMSQPFRVDAFCLYESARGRDGAIYNELERYSL